MTASSSGKSTVDLGSLGPVGKSATEVPFPPFGNSLLVDPVALRQRPQALLTMLYRSTDRLCRRGAPMKNLAHSASLDSEDKDAPSKSGIKHLGMPQPRDSIGERRAAAISLRPPAAVDETRRPKTGEKSGRKNSKDEASGFLPLIGRVETLPAWLLIR